jgi:hypothetical protein
MHTAELLYLNPVLLRLKLLLKRYKSPGVNKILAEVIQAGGNTSDSKIHKLINSFWNTEKLPQQWKESTIVPIYKKDNRSVVIIEEYHCYQLYT